MKTVRFAELVAKAGEPETHQMWVPPAKDAAFQRALKAHRVLTVHQENVGTKKDFGVVGFHEEPNAQFLVFPRSIREFEGRRVIGINYDLLAQPHAEARPAQAAPEPETREAYATAKRGMLRRSAKGERGPVSAGANAPRPPGSAPEQTREAAPAAATLELAGAQSSVVPASEASRPEPARAEPSALPPTKPLRRGKLDQPAVAPRIDPVLRREVTRALKELKAGKAVAAYERLQRLLNNLPK